MEASESRVTQREDRSLENGWGLCGPNAGAQLPPWSGNEISNAAPKSLNDETRDLAGHNQDPE